MKTMLSNLPSDWTAFLSDEINRDYFRDLECFIEEIYEKECCYPPLPFVFSAFKECSFSQVKVVLLGQDPYHGEGQAHGLSFSVPQGIKEPPSLRNIFKELKADTNEIPFSGDLTHWAEQGVLLLNTTLTVTKSLPGSHQKKGWEEFTNAVISQLSERKENLVFLLWGKSAQKKESLISSSKHLILTAAHPSPFSAYNGFFGSRHFTKTNVYLAENNIPKIKWK